MDLIIIPIVCILVMATIEIFSAGKTYIECDEGKYTCVKRFLGGEPIYKESETTWWLWPEEANGKMIICHNCRIIKKEKLI